MEISDYNLDTHKHLLASWAACRAASQGHFKFSVENGTKMLLLGVTGKKIRPTMPAEFIHHINKVKEINKQEEFDDWHHKTVENMRTGGDFDKVFQSINQKREKKKKKKKPKLLVPENLTYGIVAKILNVYLKVFYLGDFGKNTFANFIHPPIDRILLKELQKESEFFKFDCEPFEHTSTTDSGKIPKWTQINEEEYKEIIKFIREFIHKNNLKGLWRIEYAWRGHQ